MWGADGGERECAVESQCGALPLAQASGPTFLGLSASLWAAGALSANVSFIAESLGASGAVLSVPSPGRPSAQSNASRCPAELIAPTQCDWYSLRVALLLG